MTGFPLTRALGWQVIIAGLVTAIGVTMGSSALSLQQIWAVISGQPVDAQMVAVVLQFRLPRLLAALFCGALLALSGAVLQSLTRNPLADPSLIGVSQGAALAVVGLAALLPEAPFTLRQCVAIAGALAATSLLQFLAAGERQTGPNRLILIGIGISSLLSAMISLVLTHGAFRDAQSALGWMAGSLNSVGWPEVGATMITAVIAALLIPFAARPLAALRMGEDLATGLGVMTGRAKAALLLFAVAIAAIATAAIGPIAYVGLIAPHVARHLMPRAARTSVALHLGVSMMIGANSVALADLVARMAFDPLQLPAGLVTALIGVPVFLMLLLRRTAR